MEIETKPRGALRLTPCTYGLSKIKFRGPRRPTTDRYVVFLGGSETFAKYVSQPFPDLIETAIGEVCVNLGCQSAGPDVFLRDTAIQSLCHDAAATVVQIVGAVNQSNAFYKVHPRRNDRFVAPTDKLRALYPEVDFTEFAFTGHLIARLRALGEDRFAAVRTHLEKTWVRRMKELVGQVNGPVVLLWVKAQTSTDGQLDPAFVDEAMMDQMRPYVAHVVCVDAQTGDTDMMRFASLEEPAARDVMTVAGHLAVAKALRAPLQSCLD